MRKTVRIPYGKETIAVGVEKENLQGVVYPNEVEIGDEVRTLEHAIANPIRSKSFAEFAADAESILFIVNDATRPTPTAKILDILCGQIEGIDMRFIVATGIHRKPTLDEYKEIFGLHYHEFRDRVHSHDSRKNEDMAFLGTSRNGTEMWVNKMVMEADKIVIIGSVEPHYFGGYTGGRKSILPGIAAYETIEANHRMAGTRKAKPLALEGNPIHEDMEDAVSRLSDKEMFSVQAVVDPTQRVYAAAAGDISESFAAMVQKANELFTIPIDQKPDIVVAVVCYPLDINLFQSQKAVYNWIDVVKHGGIFILVSPCREGIGPENYLQLLRDCSSPQRITEEVSKRYKLGYHQAVKLIEISTRARIWAAAPVDEAMLEGVLIKAFGDPQSALDAAIAEMGDECSVLFVIDGAVTVPIMN